MQDSFFEKLGKNIASIRIAKGLSQTELALNCDKDRQSLNRLEKGRANPTVRYLKDVCDALGIDMKELFEF